MVNNTFGFLETIRMPPPPTPLVNNFHTKQICFVFSVDNRDNQKFYLLYESTFTQEGNFILYKTFFQGSGLLFRV